MPTILTGKNGIANEQSTFIVTVNFLDSAGEAVVPSSATWTLTNERSAIINEREEEVISPLAASVDIVLSGDDLKYSEGTKRIVLVEAIYDSDEGNDLPLRDQVQFTIANLVAI